MTYSQTLEYLFNSLPMFQRIGAAAYKNDLSTTINLHQKLGNPELSYPSIHIAGTNGKGSTSSMIASVLMEAGYKVGLYTSPHLVDFRERIRVNGKMVSKKFVVEFVRKNKNLFKEIQPSFFEMTFAMACEYFREMQIDIAVMEVGMGGRLDSTNIVDSKLSIITNIGFDHTAFLGNTLSKIASEKAGIIKSEIPLIIGETHPETRSVFTNIAKENKSPIYFSEEEFSVKKTKEDFNYQYFISKNFLENQIIQLPLLGNYQHKNLRTVLTALKIANEKGIIKTDSNAIGKGLKNTVKNSGLRGRWQILNKKPLTIADTAHNEDGISQVMEQIKTISAKNYHFVLGVVNDKDLDKILKYFPKSGRYYFCKPNIPRGLDANILYEKAKQSGLNGEIFNSCSEAYNSAQKSANQEDMIYIGGSTFVVAEIV